MPTSVGVAPRRESGRDVDRVFGLELAVGEEGGHLLAQDSELVDIGCHRVIAFKEHRGNSIIKINYKKMA